MENYICDFCFIEFAAVPAYTVTCMNCGREQMPTKATVEGRVFAPPIEIPVIDTTTIEHTVLSQSKIARIFRVKRKK